MVERDCGARSRKSRGKCPKPAVSPVDGTWVCMWHRAYGFVPFESETIGIDPRIAERMRAVSEDLPMRSEKERLSAERGGVTHHFEITARCGRKKCIERPNPNCTQCGGNGVYVVDGYIIANAYEDGRLGEVFVRIGQAGSSDAMLDQWAIAASMALQYGAPVDAFFKKFVSTSFEPAGPTKCAEIPRCSSVLDYVARWCLLKFGSAEARQRVLAMAGTKEEVRP